MPLNRGSVLRQVAEPSGGRLRFQYRDPDLKNGGGAAAPRHSTEQASSVGWRLSVQWARKRQMIETDNDITMANGSRSAVWSVSNAIMSPANSKDIADAGVMSNHSTSCEGSVVASPSIESFSTIPDQEDLEFNAEGGDLQVRVDNPEKHLDLLETYVTFRISTWTTRTEFDQIEYTVRRRYNDFVWLRQHLVEAFPTHIVPPLPGKHTILAQLDRYSKEFVMARMAMLHRFLTRVVSHPVLSCNNSLHAFLTLQPSEFQSHRKAGGQGILGRVSDSLQSITTAYVSRQPSPEFEAVKDYINILSEKLIQFDRVNQRLNKERLEYQAELNQLHPVLKLWSTSEPELGPLLQKMAAAVEGNAQAQQQNLLDPFNSSIAQPLREYILYVESVKEALARRDCIQMEYEMALGGLSKKRAEKEMLLNGESTGGSSSRFNLWKTPTEGKDDKLEKLAQAIPQLVRQTEENQDKLQCANENFQSDLERWHAEKKRDLQELLLTLASQQIQYYQNCLSSWEKVMFEVRANTEPTGTSSNSVLSTSSLAKALPSPSDVTL